MHLYISAFNNAELSHWEGGRAMVSLHCCKRKKGSNAVYMCIQWRVVYPTGMSMIISPDYNHTTQVLWVPNCENKTYTFTWWDHLYDPIKTSNCPFTCKRHTTSTTLCIGDHASENIVCCLVVRDTGKVYQGENNNLCAGNAVLIEYLVTSEEYEGCRYAPCPLELLRWHYKHKIIITHSVSNAVNYLKALEFQLIPKYWRKVWDLSDGMVPLMLLSPLKLMLSDHG